MNYERNNVEESPYIEKIIETKRVAKVVKGGRNFSFSAIVVVGDRQGNIGVGSVKPMKSLTPSAKPKKRL